MVPSEFTLPESQPSTVSSGCSASVQSLPTGRRPSSETLSYAEVLVDISQIDLDIASTPERARIKAREGKRTDDPDREVNPVILQYMAKSTLRAILKDRGALEPTMQKRGISRNDMNLTDKVFQVMRNERKDRQKRLQLEFLSVLMIGTDKDLLERAFLAFAQLWQDSKEIIDINPEAEEKRKEAEEKRKKVCSVQQMATRLMKGLSVFEDDSDNRYLGKCIQITALTDSRRNCKGLKIVGESSTGAGWELNDGSYVHKVGEGKSWKIMVSEAKQTEEKDGISLPPKENSKDGVKLPPINQVNDKPALGKVINRKPAFAAFRRQTI